MKHDNDRAQLEQWYDDMIARLCKTHEPSHSQAVAKMVINIRAIGDVLERWLHQQKAEDAQVTRQH